MTDNITDDRVVAPKIRFINISGMPEDADVHSFYNIDKGTYILSATRIPVYKEQNKATPSNQFPIHFGKGFTKFVRRVIHDLSPFKFYKKVTISLA